jgi:hypothetical protein
MVFFAVPGGVAQPLARAAAARAKAAGTNKPGDRRVIQAGWVRVTVDLAGKSSWEGRMPV